MTFNEQTFWCPNMIPAEAVQSASSLMDFILGLLTPFLMTSGISDPAIARIAARQAIEAYQTDGQNNLVSIAQIVGFALTSLDNLRVSMPDDVSLSMKLKLRGNANALTRSSQLTASARDRQASPAEQHTSCPDPAPQEVQATIETARNLVQRAQTAQPTERPQELFWASAMTDIAAEHAAALPQLPPAKRRDHLGRISALVDTARTLSTGNIPLRSQLLSSTSLQG